MINYDFQHIPIVDIVNQIILYAAVHNASDIHLDPREDCLIIRMRMDGELRDHTVVPKEYERNLTTRVKLISNMNITETRLPQDGAIKGRIEGKDLDMRVSALPTNEGEKVVIRILDFTKSLKGLDTLGFSEKNYKLVEKMLAVPSGIILVTGATGTGKSTTTYSMLQALNKEETNIITVEDPIEMNIEGINQVQVNSEIGLTFATVLRSILRQDPNIILIGEIRDSETAQIAVRASITGHLVLSTIHTNNSLSTIERLIDMDVERYLLSSALTGIISQKLVRTLCPDCRKKRPVTLYEEKFFKKVLNKSITETYEPVGCEHCTNGFRGRIATQEVLYMTDRLRSVLANPYMNKEELRKIVYDGSTTTLLQDALEKVVLGYTSFDEVMKTVEIDNDFEKSIISEVKEVQIKTQQINIVTQNYDNDEDEDNNKKIIKPTKPKKKKPKIEDTNDIHDSDNNYDNDDFEIVDAYELEIIDAYTPEIEIIDMYDAYLYV